MEDFLDDDFDELNDTTFQELENNAIQFTQAQRKLDNSQPPPHSQVENYDDLEFEDDDLDDTEVTNELLPPATRHVPEKPAAEPQHRLANRPALQTQQRWNPPASIVPAKPPVPSSRPRYPPPPQSFAQPVASQRFPPPVGAPRRPQPSQFGRPPPPSSIRFHPPRSQEQPQGQAQAQAQPPTGSGNDLVSALQQRLKALEAELNLARGEVAIIRSKSTKAEQEHDAEIARLKKQNAEQAAKQERAVEAAVIAEKQATTELQFLQRDIRDASTKPRRKDTAAGQGAIASGATTPKKAKKTWGMADGFDNMDIAPSPTKSRGKGRDAGPVAVPLSERTPTKGKRKRPVVDSPVMALETHEDVPMTDGAVDVMALAHYVNPGLGVLPFEFLQVILDHASLHGEPPTFDILSRYHYPSDPTTSFASLIFRELPLMGNPLNPLQLLVDFAHLITRMWAQCLAEDYLRPVWDLTSLLSFTLQLQTMSVVPQIMDELVPVAVDSVCKVALPRYKSEDGDISADPVADNLQQNIDTTYIISILYACAATCATTLTDTESGPQTKLPHFWQLVKLDLVGLLLSPKQPADNVIGMLNMLCTSALPGSIGPIDPDEDPDSVARMIIDKVSIALIDLPHDAVTTKQRHSARLAVLRALMAFANSPYGARQMASHHSVVPRLVKALSEFIDMLYDLSDPMLVLASSVTSSRKDRAVDDTPDDARDDTDDWDDGRSIPSMLISHVIQIIHMLATDPNTANTVNIAHKLSVSHGGSQRYILSLSRLSFAEEDLVYEAGIDPDTSDRAHELLELIVTPDEGDSVAESFDV
ncbi:hypothetical protein CTRI78_v007973 [Colletotrichum trifolii]|uniref:DNA repair protein Rad26 n=1 Tax=Colletotrichum trifolii TaxID=5466 RepID=A0A4R8R1I0_COLTR|nr:hypothetical protein CTRI78_v007973 [Colletotrichum trifolii]